jgi:diguanylate cyclase (GGDEF)-like protein
MRQAMLKAAFHVRSAFFTWWGFAAAGAFAALVMRGFFFDIGSPGADPVRFLVAAALCVLLAARVISRVRGGVSDGVALPGRYTGRNGGRSEGGAVRDRNVAAGSGGDGAGGVVNGLRRGWMGLSGRMRGIVRAAHDLEVGLLLVVATHAVLQLAGGVHSALYPLIYALACFVVAVDGPFVGGMLVAASLALELGILHGEGGVARHMDLFLSHLAFTVFFAAVGAVFLRAEVARLRRGFSVKVRDELERMHREAADFRLIGASVSRTAGDEAAEGEHAGREEQERRLLRGSVESIHQTLFYMLEMLKESLGLQSCVLMWLDDSGTRLFLKEAASDSDLISDRSVASRVGLVGGVLKTKKTLNLCPLKSSAAAIPYYRGPEEVGAFLGVPVVENGYVRGVLCADRKAPEPFAQHQEEVLRRASEQMLRAIRFERLFCSVERSKYEQERFFRASEMLNQAWGLDQVLDKAIEAARQIVAFEAAFVTLYDGAQKRHRIAKAVGRVPPGCADLQFKANSSLVSMAVKNRHYLPVRGDHRSHQVVFTKKCPLRDMRSVLVMPLIGGDQVVGTFVLASTASGLFTQKRREMLRVISNQVAVSVQNASMVNKLEEMATTDGLTGLLNHRTFQVKLSEMIARAERSGRNLTMVLCDIDHFKSVNDTYGHPVGDVVLKRVAKVLASSVRAVDMVARYGGEEFAVVLEETTTDGALLLAERIRSEVESLEFQSEQGAFQCTLSLGLAVYPQHGAHKQLLVEHADQALYAAKEGGRNRAILYRG